MALRPPSISPFVLSIFALSCGGDGSTPVTPAPVPTPAPTPVVAPSPGTDTGSVGSCPLGAGDPAASCSKSTPEHTAALEAAIARLVADRPALFDKNEEAAANTGQYRVLDGEAYLEGLVANLRAAGLCAERTLDRERIVVKSSNDFSEEWDVITSQGFIRRGRYSYQQSCRPASFPVAPADLISFVWVGFFAVECNAGTTALDFALLPLACDGYVTATPKLHNRRDVPSWIHGNEVTWHVRDGAELISVEPDWRYGNEFNRVLRPKGVGYFSICATVLGKQGCMNAHTVP